MIRYLLCLIFAIILYSGVHAQHDTTRLNNKDTATLMTAGSVQQDEPDDEFNIFLIVLAIGFCGAALGAVMVGAFAAFLLLSTAVLLTVAGIMSASLLAGLYKRSLKAGFRSFILISTSVLGSALGLMVLWLINYFFHLALSEYQLLWAGAGGGIIGGFLLGCIIFKMIKSILYIALYKLRLMN